MQQPVLTGVRMTIREMPLKIIMTSDGAIPPALSHGPGRANDRPGDDSLVLNEPAVDHCNGSAQSSMVKTSCSRYDRGMMIPLPDEAAFKRSSGRRYPRVVMYRFRVRSAQAVKAVSGDSQAPTHVPLSVRR